VPDCDEGGESDDDTESEMELEGGPLGLSEPGRAGVVRPAVDCDRPREAEREHRHERQRYERRCEHGGEEAREDEDRKRGNDDAARGVPVLHLEGELERQLSGQVETRIEAFAEMISGPGGAA